MPLLQVPVEGGHLQVDVREGDERRVLLLHGGPGLLATYLDPVVEELDGWTVATLQQRGSAPSTTAGPFDVGTAVSDVVATVDALGWERPHLLGHSYGGLLALLTALRTPGRWAGLLLVDSLGAVGDGGYAAFDAEMMARVLPERRARLDEMDDLPMTLELFDESMALVWPSYFADPRTSPPYHPITGSLEAYAGILPAALEELPRVAAQLPGLDVPVGLLVGEGSPMPRSAADDIADRVPEAWVESVPGAGHFPWLERPGCVRAALDRLA